MATVRAKSSAWSGWIGFAGWLMVIVGVLDFFEGMIAVIRGQYYVLAANQIVIFNVKTWGWLTLLWGIVIALAGLSLLARQGWARFFTIIVATIGLIGQLGFLGSSPYPIWTFTVVGLTVVVLYALIARWDEASDLE